MAYINLMDLCWPIGSVYLSSNDISPSEKFGGTWSEYTGAVLRASHDWSYTGLDDHTLTLAEMPTHDHAYIYIDGQPFSVENTSGVTGVGIKKTYWGQSNTVYSTQSNHPYTGKNGGGQAFSKLPRCLNLYCWMRIA